mmetsp:Transcript_30072/g.63809  ORF Transcript_30072/g.63809 Transcript_30072/m.63809 type:complete len:133 (+) Transcript_30072:654-1052(+)
MKWWCAAGFMPMTLNSRNDPKVRWEAGTGGAPEEGSKRPELLLNDYQEGAKRLTELGYNDCVLNLKSSIAKERVVPDGDEAKIETIIKNKALSKSGALFKIGEEVANSVNILKAGGRVREMNAMAKLQKSNM